MAYDHAYHAAAMRDIPTDNVGAGQMLHAIAYVKSRLFFISTCYRWRRGAK